MKRFLAFVLSLCIVFSLIPVSTITVSAEPQQSNTTHTDHFACTCALGITGCDHGTDTAPQWTAWGDNAGEEASLPTSGNYYLTKEVTLSNVAAITGTLKLCLNGYNINLNGKKITNTGDLTIMNCKATLNDKHQLTSENGKLYGGRNDGSNADKLLRFGGAIGNSGNLTLVGVLFTGNVNDTTHDCWGGGAIFTMDGMTTICSSKFYQNEAKSTGDSRYGTGGAVSVGYDGSLHVTDTVFDSNQSQMRAGAVMVYNRDSSAGKDATKDTTVYIGGNTVFTNNQSRHTSYGESSALYLWARATNGKRLTATIEGNTEITGNTAGLNGALYLRSNSATYPLQVTVQGNVKVYSNAGKTANYADVYFHDANTKLTLGKLEADANIWVGTNGDKELSTFLTAGSEIVSGVSPVYYKNKGQLVSYNGTAFALAAATKTHHDCLCAISGVNCGVDHGTTAPLTWTAWANGSALPTAAGNYYLLGDVKLTENAAISADVKLCLNGHNINLNGYKITNTGDLTIMNCKATLNNKNQLTSENGKIYGGKNQSSGATNILKYGGAIGNSGNLTLVGVLFANNVNDIAHDCWGGGALFTLDGMTTIRSCKFYQNESKHSGALTSKNGPGGAISVAYNANMTVLDSVFDQNTAQVTGGAINVYNYDYKAASASQKEPARDTSVYIGGNSVFTNNVTKNDVGSAILVRQRSGSKKLTVTLADNTEITGNTASLNGALFLSNQSSSLPVNVIVQDSVKVYGNTGANSDRADIGFNSASNKLTVGKLNADANIRFGTASAISDPDDVLQVASNATLTETDTTGLTYANGNINVGYSNTFGFTFNHIHSGCGCALTGNTTCENGHTEKLEWKAWNSGTELPTSGNYYLTKEVTLSNVAAITGTLKLCLNGYNINLNGKKITNTGDLTIMNCKATLNSKNQLTSENGKIYGGKNQSSGATNVLKYGGAIGNSGNLTLIGVLFTGNVNDIASDYYGGGAVSTVAGMTKVISCKFYQNEAKSTSNANCGSGGAIAMAENASVVVTDSVFDGNKAQMLGGAIVTYNRNASQATSLLIDGNSVFTNNTALHTNHGWGSAIYLRQRIAGQQFTATIGGNTEITGNTAAKAGAVYLDTHVDAASKPLQVIVKDSVKIDGNTAATTNAANLYFGDTRTKLSVGKLNADANIHYGTSANQADPDRALQVAAGVTLAETTTTGITYTNLGMQVGYSNTYGFTFNHGHSACGCALTGDTTCDGHVAAVDWEPWSDANALPTTTGNYYLTVDVDMSNVAGTESDSICKIAAGANVKLCLNGHNIKLNSDNTKKGSYWVPTTSSLTIMNCQAKLDADKKLDTTATVGGKIHGGSAQMGGAILAYGNLNVIGVIFEDNKATPTADNGSGGGAILVHKNSTRILHSYFANNSSTYYGSAVCVFAADPGAYAKTTLTVGDTVFENNQTVNGTVSIYTNVNTKHGCEVTVRDSLFDGNEATNKGGALYIWRKTDTAADITPKLNVTNTQFTGNTAKAGGGVLRVYGSAGKLSEVTFTDCSFTGNSAKSTGGALNVDYADLTLERVTMQNNSATSYGGAVYAKLSDVTFTDCTATGNETAQSGAVAYMHQSKLDVTGGSYTGNTATNHGGAFYGTGTATDLSEITLTGATVSENVAEKEAGGAVRIVKGHLTVVDSIIKDNEARLGGAIAIQADPDNEVSPTLTISGATELSGNKADTGGALYIYRISSAKEGIAPKVSISGDTLIINNEATYYGGGIFLQRKSDSGVVPELILSENVKIANNKSKNGGAIWFGGVEDRATVSGNVVIDGNTAEVGNDVYFFNKAQHLIVGEPGAGMKIRVTAKDTLYVADPDQFLKVAEGVELKDIKNTGIIFASVEPPKGVGYTTKGDAFYFTDVAETPHTSHADCSCTITGSACKDAKLTWKPWPYTDRLPAVTGNWYLTQDVYIGTFSAGKTGVFEIAKGQDVKLCLNGYSIKFNEKNTKPTNYYVAAGASLTIMNCRATLDASKNLVATNGGKIYGGVGTQGGAILNRGTLNLIGVHFTGNTATNKYDGQGGGALYLDRATSVIQNCLFTKNTTNMYGAAICQYAAGEVTITDTVFKENTGEMAGAVSVYSTGSSVGTPKMTINGNTKFLENVSEGAGSAIYIWRRNSTPDEHAPQVTIDGAQFTGNTAKGKGAIRIRGTVNRLTTVTISNAVFENNTSSAGGAISSESSTLKVSGSAFTKNTVTSGGGAIHSVSTDAVLEKSTFTENNTTGAGGGAMQISAKSNLAVNGCTFHKNKTSKNDGGAIRIWETTVAELKDSKFTENYSSNGGAISIFRGSSLIISGGEFTKNKATSSAGVLYAATSSTKDKTYETVQLTLKDNVLMHGNEATNGACMYIIDSDVKLESATMRDNTCVKKGNGGAFSAKNTKVTMGDGVVLKNNYAENGGAIVLQAKAVMDMNGGTIQGNSAERGGGICMWTESTLNIKGGKITGNEGRTNAGGIYVNNKSVVNMSGGSLTSNTCKHNGGAMQLYKDAKLYGYGGYIGYNTANAGGALHAKENSEIYLYGTTVEHNKTVKSNGGGICVSTKATLLIDGATIQKNEAYGRGGGVRVDIDGKVTLKSGQIIENTAGGTGGGMSIDGDAEISGGKISYNKVTGNEAYFKPRGGGIASNCQNSIYSQGFSNITISGGEISHNESAMNAGGIYMGGRTTLNLIGGVITENKAAELGGGIMMDNHYTQRASLSILKMSGGDICNNTATDGGGIYARYAGKVYLTDVTIHDNEATGNGGGVCLDKGVVSELTNLVLTKNKASKGAGLYFVDDTLINGMTVTGNEAGDGYAVYLPAGEYDGESYMLGLFKLCGDIRVLENNGSKPDMFIGKDNVLVVDYRGLGKDTKINIDLEEGVLTNTILGAYDYEGGDLKYVLTYGDRSMTEPEVWTPEADATEPDDEATEPTETGVADAQGKGLGIGGIVGISGGLIVAVIVVLVLLSIKKKKKAEVSAEETVQE